MCGSPHEWAEFENERLGNLVQEARVKEDWWHYDQERLVVICLQCVHAAQTRKNEVSHCLKAACKQNVALLITKSLVN